MTVFDVLLHASDVAHIHTLLGAFAGITLFVLFLLALRVLSSGSPTWDRSRE
jgi:uncharacterized MnhB-related membrane protein